MLFVMESMLKLQSRFAGYEVVDKLSRHHDGEREVYLAVDSEGCQAALTVFDIKAGRYATERPGRKRTPDFIDEIRFLKGHTELAGLPEYLSSGVSQYGRNRYGWIAQKPAEGQPLDAEISRQGVISLSDARTIICRVAEVAEHAARFTCGGGHYNISTSNIFVRYDGETLADVRLVGFSNLGEACNGKAPADDRFVDKRYLAPENAKGILNYRSDVYSLGMVMLTMFTGHPEGYGSVETTGSADGYYDAVWSMADRGLSNAIRLVLRKATDPSPYKRFATVDKFREFVARIGKTGKGSRPTPPAIAATTEEEDGADCFGFFPGLRIDASALRLDGLSVATKEDAVPAQHGVKTGGLDEVAGMSDVKAVFRRDFISIVRNPEVAAAYGIKPSNCTLLYGPQGCGKTFIAEHAAQESGLKYKVVKPSDLGSVYIHGAQKKIAETFAEAEKCAPMILIFDEFDALVPKRDSGINDNQANEVNEMLTQLNNCAERGIYVIATTNRPTLLDSACLRTGRIDRKIYVSLPDHDARKELFRLKLRNRPLADGIDHDLLATATDNYTCSDIAFIVDETARQCFEETLDKGLDEPLPITMSRIMSVAKATGPSVTEAQRKEFLKLKYEMENTQEANRRKKLGFISS